MTDRVCSLFQNADGFVAMPCTAREDSPASVNSWDRCSLQGGAACAMRERNRNVHDTHDQAANHNRNVLCEADLQEWHSPALVALLYAVSVYFKNSNSLKKTWG